MGRRSEGRARGRSFAEHWANDRGGERERELSVIERKEKEEGGRGGGAAH